MELFPKNHDIIQIIWYFLSSALPYLEKTNGPVSRCGRKIDRNSYFDFLIALVIEYQCTFHIVMVFIYIYLSFATKVQSAFASVCTGRRWSCKYNPLHCKQPDCGCWRTSTDGCWVRVPWLYKWYYPHLASLRSYRFVVLICSPVHLHR